MAPENASYTAKSTASTNVVKSTMTYTMIIKHIADICCFPFDSTMMNVTSQQGWAELSDFARFTPTEVSDLTLLKDDETYLAKPLAHQLPKLMCFLLLYLQKCRDLSLNLD
jgi:hypothetical protein